MATPMTTAQRTFCLEVEVQKYIRRGFRVVSRSDSTAQMVKPKTFSLLWAFLWFLLFGIGIIVYLFYYWQKKPILIMLLSH